MSGRDDPTEDWWRSDDEREREAAAEREADHDDDSLPYWFPGSHLPPDARRRGLTQHTQEGALLDFAGSLDSTKPLHRITAWAMLLVFGMPVVFLLMHLVQEIMR